MVVAISLTSTNMLRTDIIAVAVLFIVIFACIILQFLKFKEKLDVDSYRVFCVFQDLYDNDIMPDTMPDEFEKMYVNANLLYDAMKGKKLWSKIARHEVESSIEKDEKEKKENEVVKKTIE